MLSNHPWSGSFLVVAYHSCRKVTKKKKRFGDGVVFHFALISQLLQQLLFLVQICCRSYFDDCS